MLSEPCHLLPGVGAKMLARLGKCGITTIQDLLLHLPYRYQDRTRVTPIRDLRLQNWAVVVGRIAHVEVKRGKRATLLCHVEDGTGHLTLRFFHFHASQLEGLQVGSEIRAFGEVRSLMPNASMIHPEYRCETAHTPIEVEETLTPIYASTQGLSQARLRTLVKQAFEQFSLEVKQLEWMSAESLAQHGFYDFSQALWTLHFPAPDVSITQFEQGLHPAMKRLIFEELLVERMSMEFARQQRLEKCAPICSGTGALSQAFLAQLPFQLTGAQKRVVAEIQDDLAKPKPMLRLVQGDVGAGKTVVAALSLLQAVESGYQVAMMAPTDLLSEQHAQNLNQWLTPLGIEVHHLNGKVGIKQRRAILKAAAEGEGEVLVGTHALFQDKVQFKNLGLIIIDEQHRFGVAQRLALEQKGRQGNQVVHQLLMTATPIPRTLSMTQWAHLEVSTIDELPPNRTPVLTAVMAGSKREAILARLKQVMGEGQQAYWVCTLIEESEKLQCQAATDTAALLTEALAPYRIGLVHGRMKGEEKEAVLRAFKDKTFDLLVATTVIEVGVDVPNASLMIIENAERLGLAQLHQLRGRVGRGAKASCCVLLYQAPLSNVGVERLKTMRETTDGFKIAEQDLHLRGAGEVLGTKQTGYRNYKVALISRDKGMLPLVAKEAKALVVSQPDLAKALSARWKGEASDFISV